jgi:hypothetical protein
MLAMDIPIRSILRRRNEKIGRKLAARPGLMRLRDREGYSI